MESLPTFGRTIPMQIFVVDFLFSKVATGFSFNIGLENKTLFYLSKCTLSDRFICICPAKFSSCIH